MSAGRATTRLARLDTPAGRLTLVARDVGLMRVLWPGEAPPAGTIDGPHPVLDIALREIHQYFSGALRAFTVALDLTGTEFQRRAWLALAEVPYGATRAYGEQARRLGRPGAARAVGAANARNPVPIVLPCHRLVGAGGALTGFSGGVDVKQALIAHEAQVAAGGAAEADSSRTRTSRGRPPRA